MRFEYNRDYNPSIPVVDILLVTATESIRTESIQAIVDSGADGTIVPIAYLSEIQAIPTVEMVLRSQWGERRRVLMYLVDIQIGDFTIPGVEVVGDDLSDEVILGRNVLNRLRVLLDGPIETTTISE